MNCKNNYIYTWIWISSLGGTAQKPCPLLFIYYLIKYNFDQFHIYTPFAHALNVIRRCPPHKVNANEVKIFLSHSLLFDVSPIQLFRLRNVIFHILIFRFVS